MATVVKLSEGDLKRLKAEVLREQLYYLTEELGDPSRYFPFLKSRQVLEANDCELIRGKATARERTEEFVETLDRHKEGARGEAAFDVFVEALKRQKVQAHIARNLQKAFAKKKAEAEKRKGAATHQQTGTQMESTSQHEPGQLTHPIQASGSSRSSTPTPTPTQASATPPTSNGPTPQQPYDVHPDYGPMPVLPDEVRRNMERRREHSSPSPPQEDIDPDVGPLPPYPPPSSTTHTAPYPETTSGNHQDSIETGLGMEHHHRIGTGMGMGPYHMQHQHVVLGQFQQGLAPLDMPDGPNENSQMEQGHPASVDQLMAQLQLRDVDILRLTQERDQLAHENHVLRQKLEEFHDYPRVVKELEDIQEKLRNTTLSYQQQGYEAFHRQHSDIDEHMELLEERGKLQKQVEEQHSRLESLDREKKELKSQVDEYQMSCQTLQRQMLQLSLQSQTRPHHLPISDPRSLSPFQPPPPYTEPPVVGVRETPHGITPLHSVHVGDHLSHHNLQLQQHVSPVDPRPAHWRSGSYGEGGLTPLGESASHRSSNASLSSHGSTISKHSVSLNVPSGQATLV